VALASSGRILIALTGAATSIAVARLLGPSGTGAYYIAQSLIVLLTAATTLGIEHGIVYYVSAGAWPPRSAFRASLGIAVTLGLAGAAMGVLARVLVPSAFAGISVWLTAVVALALPFALATVYVTFIALAIDRYEAYMFPQVLQSMLALALVATGAILFDLNGALVGMTAAAVAVGVGVVTWGHRRLPSEGGRDGARSLARAASFGIKGYIAGALSLISYRLDLFVLSATATSAAVGRYSVAIAVTSVLWLLPSALGEILFPRVARLSANDEHSQREFVELKSLRHATLVVAAGAVVVAFALAFLVVPVYGEGFSGVLGLGLILLPGAAAIGMAVVLNSIIVGRGKPIYSLYSTLITTPPTIVLYATLIPWLHAVGAACASTLSYLGTFAAACVFYRRITRRRVFPALVPTRAELEDIRALLVSVRSAARRRLGRV
jgi:O-antigen/teichoic acid export membrane protein